MLQVLGIVAIIAMVATLLLRPSSIVAMVLAGVVVIAAIVVSWNDIEQTRAQHAAPQQRSATATAVTVPPPSPARSGS